MTKSRSSFEGRGLERKLSGACLFEKRTWDPKEGHTSDGMLVDFSSPGKRCIYYTVVAYLENRIKRVWNRKWRSQSGVSGALFAALRGPE